MYSIVHVIYGLPLINVDPQQFGNDEPEGFEMLYSGSSDAPVGYCGVRLDQFDECNGLIAISALHLQPTPEEELEAQIKVQALPESMRVAYEKHGIKMGVYFAFSTS